MAGMEIELVLVSQDGTIDIDDLKQKVGVDSTTYCNETVIPHVGLHITLTIEFFSNTKPKLHFEGRKISQ